MTKINTHFAVALFCFLLMSLLGMSQPFKMLTDCKKLPENVTQTSSYRSNRDTVLSTLRNHSSLGRYYSNATTGLSPNTIYGMFLCRGDISTTSCSDCVHTAMLEIAKSCFNNTEAYIFYEQCLVRYSNFSFFKLVEDAPSVARYYPISSLDSRQYIFEILPQIIDELILKASSSSSSPDPYFEEEQYHDMTQLDSKDSFNVEAMVQCSPDLDPRNCTACLTFAVKDFFKTHSSLAQIFFPKCLVRYNISSALHPNVSSHGVTKGYDMMGRTFIAIMTALVLAVVGL